MKGSIGLAIAAGLGIVGAICNWLYLERLAGEQETVQLVALRNDVQLNIGDSFEDSDLEPVPIPESRAGNLIERAVGWRVRDTVVGERATRAYYGGEIILEEDLVTPAIRDLSETLQDNQVARWVPIDGRSVVPDQINPGDMVSFEVPRTSAVPTPAGTTPPIVAAGSMQLIGPFRVLALGTRRERPGVAESARTGSRSSSNTITIVVDLINGQLEPKAAQLFEAIRLSENNGVAIQLHSSRVGEGAAE
jgi:Flp pilus assembly protein CpaB